MSANVDMSVSIDVLVDVIWIGGCGYRGERVIDMYSGILEGVSVIACVYVGGEKCEMV